MTLTVGLIGLCLLALGLSGLARPARVLDLVERLQSRSGLYVVAVVRVLTGIALLFAAPGSRMPLYLKVVGALALVSGLVTPFFGVERFGAVLQWWRARSPLLLRAWCALVALFGLSLVWAVFPELRAT